MVIPFFIPVAGVMTFAGMLYGILKPKFRLDEAGRGRKNGRSFGFSPLTIANFKFFLERWFQLITQRVREILGCGKMYVGQRFLEKNYENYEKYLGTLENLKILRRNFTVFIRDRRIILKIVSSLTPKIQSYNHYDMPITKKKTNPDSSLATALN